jgi:hypothetical protein
MTAIATGAATITRTVPATPRPAVGRRLAAAALVVGAALNTAEAVLTGAVLGGRGRTTEEEIAAALAQPGATTAIAVLGIASVPAMLIGFQAMAHVVRGRFRRLGAVAAVLGFLGTLGYLGMQSLGLASSILLGAGPQHAEAITTLREAPLGLVVVAPFLIGMFGAMALLTAGLAAGRATRGIAGAFGLFLLLDLTVGAVGPVDPHWLFLAGSVGLAVLVLRAGDEGWANARLSAGRV